MQQRRGVEDVLASVDATPASYLRAARELEAGELREALQPLQLGVLATFTFDTIVPYLVVEGARRGFAISTVLAPYGQLEQVALDPGHPIHAADVIVVALRVEDVARELAERFVALSPAQIDEAIAAHVGRIATLIAALRERSRATVLLWNQAPLARLSAGLADAMLERSQTDAIGQLDRELVALVRATPGVVLFDAARLATEVGVNQWYDARLQHLGRIPFSAAAQRAIGERLARTLAAARRAPAKCLVLDLDNTLWGGVLGEAGLGGIALGEDLPGSAFKTFQRQCLALRDRGVLLAIASKNNETDVLEAFSSHPDMVLRWDHFAARQVHWNDKASSLRAIAEELSIGRDALVFFDDNPVERAWVKEQLPEVTVVDVPTDPLRYFAALDAAAPFDHLVIGAEDRQRADYYQQDVQRKDLESSAGSLEAFLAALGMRVKIGAVDRETHARVCQLLAKTNQFNTTTRRHSEAELEQMIGAGAIALWMRVEDRYGDSGLVGVGIAAPRDEPGEYVVDSFLMSCRVLGRRVEHALLASLARRVVARGGHTLVGEFIPTKKNAPAAEFFATAGFTPVDPPRWWKLDLSGGPPPPPSLFEIEDP